MNTIAQSNQTPLYFGQDEQIFGWLHLNNHAAIQNTAIVICQPIALEYMSAYRSMRKLADSFANEGFPTLRFDYLGTGDSGGFTEEDRLVEYCVSSISQAVREIKRITECQRICLVGLRLGATFATLYAEENPIDELILWAPVEKGKRYLREVRALQKSSSNQSSSLLEAAGMVYWTKTQHALEQIELIKSRPKAKYITLVPRDDLKINNKLYEEWSTHLPSNVQMLQLPGSSGMLLLAEDTIVPETSFKDLINQLKARSAITDHEISLSSIAKSFNTPSIHYDEQNRFQIGEKINELACYYDTMNKYFGILAKSINNTNDVCLVLINSGAIHRVGSNRLHVILSRTLALNSISCFRMDVPGLGDSITENRELENKEHIDGSEVFIETAINYLKREFGYENFILAGLSSGAFYAYNGLLRVPDSYIKDALVINPEQFYNSQQGDADLADQLNGWMYYRDQIKNLNKWKEFFSGNVDYRYIVNIVFNKFRTSIKKILNTVKIRKAEEICIANNLAQDLYYLANQNKHVQFIFSENDPAESIVRTLAPVSYRKLIHEKKIGKINIAGADHTFSKYDSMICLIKSIEEYLVASLKKS